MHSLIDRLRQGIQSLPLLRGGDKKQKREERPDRQTFPGSAEYWEGRYAQGGNSGVGSYGELAQYKARVVNDFVREKEVQSVVEFGTGDGNQLSLFHLPHYVGLDVSATAINSLKSAYAGDKTKEFWHIPDGLSPELADRSFDLALSLDVIYHLTEDSAYEKYMLELFSAASRYVIIYSSNSEQPASAPHVRHRCFTDFVRARVPGWHLSEVLDNPLKSHTTAQFFLYHAIGTVPGLSDHT